MPTIKDVAKLAGVSVSTVSLALNGSKAVKLETRYHVMNAAKALKYKPNLYARSLVMQKFNTIGIVRSAGVLSYPNYSFETSLDTYLTEMLRSIECGIYERGYTIYRDWIETEETNLELPPIFHAANVDGVLMVGGIVSDLVLEKVAQLDIPVVLIGARSPLLDYVDTDPCQGVELAVRHLAQQGHRDIAFINGPDSSQSSHHKWNGYTAALESLKLPLRVELTDKQPFSGRGGYEAMRRIYSGELKPTAVVAAADCMAIGAIRYLFEHSVYCPQDISVVGFEDGMLAEYCIPPLTTVCVHKEELGTEGCNILFKRLKEPGAQKMKLLVSPHLVHRGSVLPR